MMGGRGAFDIDHDYLKKCEAQLSKMDTGNKFDEAAKQKDVDGRSMLEVMREKRQAAEREIEE